MGSGEEKKFARIESVKATRVLPEGTKDCPEHDDNDEFQLEERLLIDPKHLFVGPKIGEGAHSKVYEGNLGRESGALKSFVAAFWYKDKNVAIKIIQVGDNLEEKSKLERRFTREVALLARVQHKNLVKFIGAFKDSMMVVVTELLVGGSLRKHMTSLKPNCIEIRTALSFALDVAQAMECLHKNGIIHRDLKPDNLLLTADQKRVKLADFGLAREETVTEMMTAETGTYRWMAPELYSTVTLKRGEKKHYDHRVDVYSFSIVLWELLTNRMPFEGMSNLQAAYAAAFKNVRPSVENLPEDLVFILQCCWAEDPNMRPNFTQIVRMLSTYISSLPTPESTPPSPQTLPSRSSISSMTSPGASSMSGSQTDISGKLQKSPRKLISCFGSCIGS